MLDTYGLSQLPHKVKDLPVLPQAVLEVLQVLRNDNLSAEHCIQLIEKDPALAARTLRLANSAFYGAPGRVARIADAVSMLGLRTVSGVLAAAALTQAFPASACAGFDFAAYWRHGLAVAMSARSLASHCGLDPEQAFLAGLMHDIGQLVLAAHFPAAGNAVQALMTSTDVPRVRAEQTLLGQDHCQVGALLAVHWRFPAPIVEAIAQHHAPPPAAASAPAALDLTGLVHACDAVAHALDLAGLAEEAVPEIDLSVWTRLRLDEARAMRLFASVEGGVRDMCAALSL
ncbi:HDOD domain-containing protein [Ideonella azotifigens]|uniref:HDOD domain-containing protein n=1 Tax=Ideonella azotifigens TaxID=513160 RepID=A0ABN1K4G3_9BURK|nr:HDOD domain-containing protein [Ideonella azotifigens]MCD2344325.1 HDOD domain-containing protein [Ideonella azotifigens]